MGKLYHLRGPLGLQCDVVEISQKPGQRGLLNHWPCGGEAWYIHELPSGGTQRLCQRHARGHKVEEDS